jgi:E3 ubiquitin-protein ligase NRDP1
MGYDLLRFKSSDINEEFICSICRDVLKDPLVIDPCDHIFCSECIKTWISEQGLS